VRSLLCFLVGFALMFSIGTGVTRWILAEDARREAEIALANQQRFRDFLGGDTGEVRVKGRKGHAVELVNSRGRGIYWVSPDWPPCERGETWVVTVDGDRLKFLSRK
jgi:arabinogalactan endo-1,4-beta-galactosidase